MKIFIGLIMSVGLLLATVDINHASKSELMELKGVGSKKADAILKYREHNCFTNIQSLKKVKGIGAKFIENNKEDIVVGKCE